MANNDKLHPVTTEAYASFLMSTIRLGKPRKIKMVAAEECLPMLEKNGLEVVLRELVCNCSEKNEGAVTVSIALISMPGDMARLEVADDVVYKQTELEEIFTNVDSDKPKRMGKGVKRPTEDEESMGMGLKICRNSMILWGGNLWYEKTDTGGIKAVAEWKRAKFFETSKISSQIIEFMANG